MPAIALNIPQVKLNDWITRVSNDMGQRHRCFFDKKTAVAHVQSFCQVIEPLTGLIDIQLNHTRQCVYYCSDHCTILDKAEFGSISKAHLRSLVGLFLLIGVDIFPNRCGIGSCSLLLCWGYHCVVYVFYLGRPSTRESNQNSNLCCIP